MEQIRMLIVDDVAQVRQDLRTLLTLSCAVEVVGEAANGQEAITQAEVFLPDVILMDLEMPSLDGYLATRQIKNLYPTLKIIALTVHGYPEAREKALQAGVDTFIVKGEPVESLVQAIMENRK
jgi:DNA-binding NarL/FixJ family response regulator